MSFGFFSFFFFSILYFLLLPYLFNLVSVLVKNSSLRFLSETVFNRGRRSFVRRVCASLFTRNDDERLVIQLRIPGRRLSFHLEETRRAAACVSLL